MISPWWFPRCTRPCLNGPYCVNTQGVSCITLAGTNPPHATRGEQVKRVTDHVYYTWHFSVQGPGNFLRMDQRPLRDRTRQGQYAQDSHWVTNQVIIVYTVTSIIFSPLESHARDSPPFSPTPIAYRLERLWNGGWFMKVQIGTAMRILFVQSEKWIDHNILNYVPFKSSYKKFCVMQNVHSPDPEGLIFSFLAVEGIWVRSRTQKPELRFSWKCDIDGMK